MLSHAPGLPLLAPSPPTYNFTGPQPPQVAKLHSSEPLRYSETLRGFAFRKRYFCDNSNQLRFD